MAINSNRIESVSTGRNGVLTLDVSDSSDAVDPVSLTDAKDWLRVEGNADDSVIGDILNEVIDEVENQFKIPVRSKDVVATWDSYGASVNLPFTPVSSITSVVTTDSEGNDTTLTVDEDYRLIGNKLVFDTVYLSEVPYNKTSLTVTYVSKYSTLPKGIILGLKKAILDNYENRESLAGFSVTELPEGAKKKFKRYMRYT